MKRTKGDVSSSVLQKCPTGNKGLDDVTFGGLPRGRNTLVCGDAGTGKTLLGMEFVMKGALQYGEPGVVMAFEETAEDLVRNVASLGYDLNKLCAEKKVILDYVRIERSEIEETGEYDLEALFVRLDSAITSIGAKRVLLDTIESIFSGLTNQGILRAELRRLFQWLKARGVTTVITGERGEKTLTRRGLEEYVSDCVILLDNRVIDQISTRRIRILKYRGSLHGTNEYPFMINERGITILPITSVGLTYEVPTERVSSGIPRLDTMLGGGFYRGSSILISGMSGTGKSSVACGFADSVCRRNERCLYFAHEESPAQIIRNMRSIGIDLEPWIKKNLLQIHATRATNYGLETHLSMMQSVVDEFNPNAVVIDPVSSLLAVGDTPEVRSMLTRMIDYLKSRQITCLLVSLVHGDGDLEKSETEISSLMDTWIILQNLGSGGERNRGLFVLKSRGMKHSNQIREFILSDKGIDLIDAYLGPGGVLTGTARFTQEAEEKATALLKEQEVERLRRDVERERKITEAKIALLQSELAAKEDEINRRIKQEERVEKVSTEDREYRAHLRAADKNTKQAKN